jgi:hypothetical protein
MKAVKRILIAALAGKGIAHPSKVQCGQELAVGQASGVQFQSNRARGGS